MSQDTKFQCAESGGLTAAVASMQGRRTYQEDASIAVINLRPGLSLFAVLDGHGGSECSQFLASQEGLSAALAQAVDGDGGATQALSEEGLEQLCGRLDQQFLASHPSSVAGSTCCMAVVRRGGGSAWSVAVANVGDSRALLLRASGEVVELSEDHKPSSYGESRRIHAAGGTVKGDRIDGSGLACSRAFGDRPYKRDDTRLPQQQKVICLPDVETIEAKQGDHLLLFSDGLLEAFSNEDLAAAVGESAKRGCTLKQTLDHVLKQSFDGGSGDNMTVQAMYFLDTILPKCNYVAIA